MKLIIQGVEDLLAQENFVRIEEYLNSQSILKGAWQFFDIDLDQAYTKKPFAHLFKFIPKDVIQTYKSGVGDITWEYDSFDRNCIYVTSTAAVKVRAFVGLYTERSRT